MAAKTGNEMVGLMVNGSVEHLAAWTAGAMAAVKAAWTVAMTVGHWEFFVAV